MNNSKPIRSVNFYIASIGLYGVYLFLCHLMFVDDLQIQNNILTIFGMAGVKLYFVVGMVVSLLFIFRRKDLIVIAFFIAMLITLPIVNPRARWVSYPNLPLSMIAFFVFMAIEKDFLPKKTEGWMEFFLFLTLGVSYFASGMDKMQTPQWFSGQAVSTLITTHHMVFRKNYIVHWILNTPWAAFILNYTTMLIELSGALLIFKKIRIYVLFALLSLHSGISFFMILFELSIPYFIMIVWLLLREFDKKKTGAAV